jgi:endonuclease/exonuclease/phosphatase family metal-dependent hydrolase
MFKRNILIKLTGEKFVLSFLFLLIFLLPNSSVTVAKTKIAPDIFSYEELTTLYDQKNLPESLDTKLNRLLTTPFVENSFSSNETPNLAKSLELGEHLKVALWNVERGLEYSALEAAFTDISKFISLLDKEKFPPGSKERSGIIEQAEAFQTADVIILNEVDWGVKRSGYRHVAADLAKKLRMNYAFGVQFVELSPVNLTREAKSGKAEENESLEVIRVDAERYKGLHGVAILSRFPLENVRLIPFKNQPYDWYGTEKDGPSILEQGKRKVTEEVFLEKTLREVRRGGRTTLYAEISDERFPMGKVTIVATHLENRTKPEGRVKQLQEILMEIKDIKNPVIMAGDMNTSGKDLRPTSIQRELTKRFGNPKFWVKKGISYALGFGLVEDVFISGVTFGRTQGDPTVKNIPFFSPNPARKFFSTLEDFKFSDGKTFDFRGDKYRSSNGRGNTFANSNQRDEKGFVTTYQVKRPLKVIGKYKLDWFFIKPDNLTDPDDDDDSYKFAPHFGRTLYQISDVIEERISDHHPLLVSLPLNEPRIGVAP